MYPLPLSCFAASGRDWLHFVPVASQHDVSALSIMNSSDKLKIRIRNVFGEIPFPEHLGYSAAIAIDSWISDPEELKRIVSENDKHCDWWDIPYEEVPYLGLAMCYFDAHANQFYLPICLSIAIESPEYKKYCSLLDWMTPIKNEPNALLYDCFVEKMSALTDEQKEVCRECLKYVQENLDPRDCFSSERIDNILSHEYWQATH